MATPPANKEPRKGRIIHPAPPPQPGGGPATKADVDKLTAKIMESIFNAAPNVPSPSGGSYVRIGGAGGGGGSAGGGSGGGGGVAGASVNINSFPDINSVPVGVPVTYADNTNQWVYSGAPIQAPSSDPCPKGCIVDADRRYFDAETGEVWSSCETCNRQFLMKRGAESDSVLAAEQRIATLLAHVGVYTVEQFAELAAVEEELDENVRRIEDVRVLLAIIRGRMETKMKECLPD